MGNIITYVQQNGHLAFDELGFNEVDSLILSQLSYLDYSCCSGQAVPFSVTIGTLRQRGFQADCPANRVSVDRCRQLFDAMENSRRYRDIGVDLYVSEIDPEEEKQFAAVVFRLSYKLHYIAFRGTDATVVGWKEDLNMSYMEDIPAQRAALETFVRLAGRMRSHYILGGHSKGGNLAVYAAAHAPENLRRSVALVYDHDGPGFLPQVRMRPGFCEIAPRVYKTVPESAVVGMLLTDQEKYSVVASDAIGLFQHDPFSWKVEGADFVEKPQTDILSRAMDSTLTRWISETTDENRKVFVDTLFGIIAATGAQTLPELSEGLIRNAGSVAAAIRDIDPAVRKMMLASLRSLLRASGKGVKDTLDGEWLRLRDQLDEQLTQARQEIRTEIQERFSRLNPPRK